MPTMLMPRQLTKNRAKRKSLPVDEEIIKDLLTEQQIARGLGLSVLTVRIWRKEKSFPYVRLEGDNRDAIRFRLEKVMEWCHDHEVEFNPSLM